jgi:hypothetical protein
VDEWIRNKGSREIIRIQRWSRCIVIIASTSSTLYTSRTIRYAHLLVPA